MLTRTVLARREPIGVVVSAAMLSVLFTYLGVSLLTAVTAALIWVAVSLSGGRIIEALIGEVEARQRWLLAMGPGALLSMCLVVLGFLFVRGGWLGNVLVVAAFSQNVGGEQGERWRPPSVKHHSDCRPDRECATRQLQRIPEPLGAESRGTSHCHRLASHSKARLAVLSASSIVSRLSHRLRDETRLLVVVKR
jgi:hypothetical protein